MNTALRSSRHPSAANFPRPAATARSKPGATPSKSPPQPRTIGDGSRWWKLTAGRHAAAALEDGTYPIDTLIFDLANLRAGPRFAGEDSPFGGKLGHACQMASDRADLPGYLTLGVPLAYGAGASEAMRAHVESGVPRAKLLTETLRLGDFERAFVEWRSLLRHIVWAPEYEWVRWRALKNAAAATLDRTGT
jgi:hypothetical protein